MRVVAPAKVTVSLHVTGVRSDGMHEIDAIAVVVDDLYDTLLIEPGATWLRVDPAGAAPAGTDNLVLKALEYLGVSARIELLKTIPTQAGLGGGSADAAAVLRALGTNEAPAALHEIATSLGSDVPICLQSRPTRMLGVGDVLEPLTPCAPLHLVIATPRFGCATPAVYRAWDELDGPVSDRVIAAPTGWTAHCAEFRNDLEPAAIRVQPQLRAFRESFARIVHREPMLCGSGSSYCVWFDSRAEADAAADAVTQAGLDARMVCAASSR